MLLLRRATWLASLDPLRHGPYLYNVLPDGRQAGCCVRAWLGIRWLVESGALEEEEDRFWEPEEGRGFCGFYDMNSSCIWDNAT